MSDIRKLCEVVCANLKEQAIQEWALKKANSSHSKLQRKWQQNTNAFPSRIELSYCKMKR
ncbi:hypothetical protein L917_18810 [Phytophthora nicotianae]|uniref:Uncharacterized protein n=3 Tax=Phytophthora nicotianae TaxID=4792 RepID=V9E3M3_PHYNI|nr:hypothetical protein F443_19665 [Phytophthora nicotianae P1569]ETL80716.1 hypothetical protein L917_18810 [Phytophthora nicotianae]ETM33909.1 hypothetical protein L914_18900 [Phytophthora nicotianae]ETO62466.1 hypothetical protein F444_19623 [Phytophthora nicotianae P1976]